MRRLTLLLLCLLFPLLSLACGGDNDETPVVASPVTTAVTESTPLDASPTAPVVIASPETLAECDDPAATVCAIQVDWSEADFEAAWQAAGEDVWEDDGRLTFAWRGEADEVTLGGGLELPLERIGDTDLWTVTVAVANIDQAVISYWFVPTRDGQTPEGRFIARVWRGPAVPEQAFVTTIFEGSVQVQTVASAALGENRIVSVYVPPSYDPDSEYPVIYMADGGMTRDLAAVIDVPIQQGTLPPVLLVGVHLPEESAEDWRSAEYLPGVDPERFAAHEQFFTEELPDFLTEYFAATTDRERVAVLGIEEGASFALAMIGAHSDRYGIAMPFALGTDEGLDEIDWDPLEPSRFYLVSGAFNAQSSALTRAWSERLTDSGHEVARQERVGGNDLVIWQEEFVNAIRWAFSDGQRGFSQADE